jgi:DNA helicase-2/ATP-dependent DNA helicase PcrA
VAGPEEVNGVGFGKSAHATRAARDVQLDDSQLRFVRFQEGCAVLHAPVGTGKTLALAERAAEAIRRGMEPSRILCLTFTNRAAEELRQRIAVYCGNQARRVMVRTFHGLCAWMLRVEAKNIGFPSDFAIFDDEDSTGILSSLRRRKITTTGSHYVPPNNETGLYSSIARAKVDAPDEALSIRAVPEEVFQSFAPMDRGLAVSYQQELASYHAFDFADLIYFARAMLVLSPAIRSRWDGRFSMLQVDEMQDTHLSEYQILRILAQSSRNLVLAGDFDQTIYEWRGSTPDRILRRFHADFPEAREFSFKENHRATRTLIKMAGSVASSYSKRTPPRPAQTAPIGEPIIVHFAGDSTTEAKWIARKIRELVHRTSGGIDSLPSYGRIGVLVRPNHRGVTISQVFEREGVPHLTVETFEFFRRQEVKDAIAYLRFLCNPADGRSFHRILLRPARGIGERTIARIHEAQGAGLRLVDMVSPSTLTTGDPFGRFLRALKNGRVTVFDTETTGLNPGKDEIVELAAVQLEHGKKIGEFHRYLRNTVSVGESERIHGISDVFLKMNGEEPHAAIQDFLRFASDSLLVGHNVSFDLRMLTTHARRLGIDMGTVEYADTLELARRFLDGDDFSLEALAQRFTTSTQPTHRAIDDVNATLGLLPHLVPLVSASAAGRIRVVSETGSLFVRLAAELRTLRDELGRLRPPTLLKHVIERSGLIDYYEKEPRRIENLKELIRVFEARDDPDDDALSSLESLLGFVALARNVDRIDPHDERVRVLTVHQAKGLEFDTVFVAGLSENEFPGYYAIAEGRELEEKRIFYVAVTRAREKLFLTGHANHQGKYRKPSRYFGIIGDSWREEGSSAIAGGLRRPTGLR